MSQYNPELFQKSRLSERLAELAKDRLDELGRPDLKKELDNALFGTDSPVPSIRLGDDSKGFLV